MSVKQIDPKQTYETLQRDQNAIYIDVRTPEEFVNGHVPGAVNIPVMSPDPISRRMSPNPNFLSPKLTSQASTKLIYMSFGKTQALSLPIKI